MPEENEDHAAQIGRLKRKRSGKLGQITRCKTTANEENATFDSASSALTVAQRYVGELLAINSTIEEAAFPLDTYHEEMDDCSRVSSVADQAIREITARCTALAPASNATETNNVTPVNPNPPVKPSKEGLPTLSITPFDGNMLNFRSFLDMFRNQIESRGLPDIENLSYLMSLLKGPALTLVNNLQINNQNYKVAMEKLKNKYGNEKKVVEAYLDALDDIKPGTTAETLDEFVTNATSALRELENNNFNTKEKSFDWHLMRQFEKRLSSTIIDKMKVHTGTPGIKNVEHLLSTLELVSGEMAQVRPEVKLAKNQAKENKRPYQQNKSFTKYNEYRPRGTQYTAAVTTADDTDNHMIAVSTVPSKSTSATTQRRAAANPGNQAKCTLCLQDGHRYFRCSLYDTDEKRTKRAMQLNLCKRCFKSNHVASECRALICDNCRIPGHATSKCFKSKAINKEREKSSGVQTGTSINTVQTISSEIGCSESIALPTAQITLMNDGKLFEIRALADFGAQRSIVSQETVDTCKLTIYKKLQLTLDGFGNKGVQQWYDIVSVPILIKNELINIDAIVIERLPERIQTTGLEKVINSMKNKGLDMADSNPTDVSKINLLIGCDWLFKFVQSTEINGINVINSKFGLMVAGKLPGVQEKQNKASQNVITLLKIGVQPTPSDVDFLWSLESIGIEPEEQKPDDIRAQKMFEETVSYENNKYTARLPFRRDPRELPNNYYLAKNRLNANLTRLRKYPKQLEAYDKAIQEQIQEGFVERVYNEDDINKPMHFLTHHGVAKDSVTTPLRIVFNCSLKTKKSQLSLNDCLYQGPNLLPEMTKVLLRFRLNRFAIIADIKKAFLQVGLHEEDRDWTRFLWPENPTDANSKLMTLRYCNVLFGSAASQFLLNAVIKHHLKQATNTNIAEAIDRNLYVDNVLFTSNNSQLMLEFYNEAKEIMAKANLPLVAWASNSLEATEIIPQCEQDERKTIGVLGMSWNMEEDTINVKDSFIDVTHMSKRTVLSGLASVFDPLGMFSPITLKAKLIMKQLWNEKLGWDDVIPEEMQAKWKSIAIEYQELSKMKLPRAEIIQGDVELHVFTDASKDAYGAVIYAKQGHKQQFIISKSKVAPSKNPLTIPRLELTAVALAAKLINYVEQAYEKELIITHTHVYCDSEVCLGWLKSNARLPVYVQNRVMDVHRRIPNASIHYVNTKENVADILSRPCSLKQLIANKNWWKGPQKVMSRQMSCEPLSDISRCKERTQEEVAKVATMVASVQAKKSHADDINSKNPVLTRILERSSSFDKAVRILGRILRCTRKSSDKSAHLHLEEINEAKNLLIKLAQKEMYHEESKYLEKNKGTVPELVKELNLTMQNGLIVAQRRLKNADIDPCVVSPILLHKDHKLTSLIIQDMHAKSLHGGTNQTLTQIRRQYWIPKARTKVKLIIKHCVPCQRENARAYNKPPEAALPKERVQRSRPFSIIGMDYGGPLLTRTKRTTEKKYIALFTCATTRAIHLEVANDLTARSFLQVFQRFAARRGYPEMIICDNAKNFQKGKILLEQNEIQSIEENLNRKGIKFRFIPSRSPHFGGMYERMIGLTKTALRKTLGKALVNAEELHTVLCNIEAQLNDRPITYVSDQFDDDHPLTPSMLATGYELTRIPQANVTIEDLNDPSVYEQNVYTKRHKYMQVLQTKFWDRWNKEYLLTLRSAKQNNIHRSPKVNDVVLIHENCPKLQWKMGRILELLYGPDNIARVAKIKTKNGILTRAIINLYPLEVNDERSFLKPNPEPLTTGDTDMPPAVNQEEPTSINGTHSMDTAPTERPYRSRRVAAEQARKRIRDQLTSPPGECVGKYS